MSQSRQPSARRAAFRVGGKVIVRMGPTRRTAQIVEDRGLIGRGGRRILRVRFIYPKGEAQPTFEVPTDQVVAVKQRPARSGRARSNAHSS